jgi:CRP-like cAMP-binding protein
MIPAVSSFRRSLPLRCQSCALLPKADAGPCPFTDLRYGAGDVLMEQGPVPPRILFLRRGQVVLSSSSSSGRDLSCAVRGAGTMLGLEAVLERPLPYAVRALTDVTLCVVDIGSFKSWIGPLDSPLGAALRLSLEETIRRAGERQAVEGTAVRRVARFLAQTTDADDAEPDIPHGVLASVLGMRAETLSRALGELRALGALADGRRICVVDRQELRRAAE